MIFKTLLLAILIVLPTAANSHSTLASSSPKNGQTFDVPPTEIVMQFKSPAKLIKVGLTRQSDKQGKAFLADYLAVVMVSPCRLVRASC